MHRVQEGALRVGKEVRAWHRMWENGEVTNVEGNRNLFTLNSDNTTPAKKQCVQCNIM